MPEGSRFVKGCGKRSSDRLIVLEAVQPVRTTTVEEFQKRGTPGTFHAKRLKSPPDAAGIEKARAWGRKQLGLDYDARFQWGGDKLYCSELVWKVYKKAGIELCATKRFRDYELESPEVKKVIAERYGSKDKMPRDEPVVSPGDLADSPLLILVPKLSN